MNEVVVVLPYVGNAVLMQLRDKKDGIDFPGCCGFFGGAIEPEERPETAARREVEEELELRPESIDYLSSDRVDDLDGISVHSFYFPLSCKPYALALNEGEDAGLFTVEEIRSKQLFSQKKNYITRFATLNSSV